MVWLGEWIEAHPQTPPSLAVFDALAAIFDVLAVWLRRYSLNGCAFVHAELLHDDFRALAEEAGIEAAESLALSTKGSSCSTPPAS
ncbi:MAG TPA: hypothetical protein VK991_07675 [Halomonas sp.]|nr:hypothetical protein [Halomonas sp.]